MYSLRASTDDRARCATRAGARNAERHHEVGKHSRQTEVALFGGLYSPRHARNQGTCDVMLGVDDEPAPPAEPAVSADSEAAEKLQLLNEMLRDGKMGPHKVIPHHTALRNG